MQSNVAVFGDAVWLGTPGSPRVLLVDGDAALRARLSHFLMVAGYQVSQASDPIDAMRRLGWEESPRTLRRSFDAVIVDDRMPGMTGREFAELVRYADSATPVIIMCAQVDSQLFRDAQRVGVNAILAKPIQFDDLLAHLDDLTSET